MKHLEINREQVSIERELGEGQFGKVYEASAVGLPGSTRTITVAVKFLSTTDPAEQSSFVQEAVRMVPLTHDHIVRLLAVCFRSQPIFFVIEHMPKGDLKQYLIANRARITLNQQVEMCRQVASALVFLAELKYVHRDIAARNVLVDAIDRVKLSDFGLARDVYLTEYYRKTGSGALPLRWMSPESVFDGIYNAKSDVWMFGVLLWEIFSYAALPWSGMNDFEVMAALRRKSKMKRPTECPENVYQIMVACWTANPLERATAGSALTMLNSLADSSSAHETIVRSPPPLVDCNVQSPPTQQQVNPPALTQLDRYKLLTLANIDDEEEESRL